MNCNVCFDIIFKSSNAIRCYDEKCSSVICIDCMKQYIDSSGEIPKCVSNNCSKMYIFSKIIELPGEYIRKYNKTK